MKAWWKGRREQIGGRRERLREEKERKDRGRKRKAGRKVRKNRYVEGGQTQGEDRELEKEKKGRGE